MQSSIEREQENTVHENERTSQRERSWSGNEVRCKWKGIRKARRNRKGERAREVVTCNSPHDTQVGREKLRSRTDSVKTMRG